MAQNNRQIIEKAAIALRNGELVALPTETVYGIGVDALNENAIARLRQVKNRENTQAISVLIASIDDMKTWAREIPDTALALAEQHWPGPLTIVLKKKGGVSDSLTGGTDTIGLRVPDHPFTLEIIKTLGNGIAAPSANRKGEASPTTAEEVKSALGHDVDLIIDGGPCTHGTGSTIVDLTGDTPKVLRQGSIEI